MAKRRHSLPVPPLKPDVNDAERVAQPHPQPLSLLPLFIKSILLTFTFVLILFLISGGVIGWWTYQQVKLFTTTAGTNITELRALAERGWQEPVVETNGYKNILLLGIDSLSGRGDVPPLSDTMMLISVNVNSATINMVPLPRDLWSDAYQTKINALLAYGQERNPANPAEFPTQAIQELTGVPIHHTVVLTLDQVGQIIDLLGGIEIDVPQGFVDEQFPRPDVDVTVERDPKKLYQRIEFNPGMQQMNGERVLQYVRSRHAAGTAGGDEARSQRQQLVIQALITKLQDQNVQTNIRLLAQLFAYYTQNFSKYFTVEQGIATLRRMYPLLPSLKLQSHALPIFPTDSKGIIFNPPLSPRQYQGQWVYAVKNPELFKVGVNNLLTATPSAAASSSSGLSL